MATIPDDIVLTANNSGITLYDFFKSFIGSLPLGFEWVYIFFIILILSVTLIWFFKILDIRYWFNY